MGILANIFYLILGFIVIIKGSYLLVDGSVNLAKFFKIPSLIIGLTIVAIATGVPEIAISISSSFKGTNGILLGNLLGSNMFNILFILGLLAIIKKVKVSKEVINKNYLYALLSCMVLFFIAFDTFFENSSINIITRTEGILLICFALVFLYSTVLSVKKEAIKVEKTKFSFKDVINIAVGIILIAISADVIVNSAVKISSSLGVSENLIGLTIIAIGTNLPEFVTSVVAVKKGETDVAIGNLIGTNIYNIFLILGLAATINPITINHQGFLDIISLTIVSFIVYIFIRYKKDINKIEGIIMIILYIIYLGWVIIR